MKPERVAVTWCVLAPRGLVQPGERGASEVPLDLPTLRSLVAATAVTGVPSSPAPRAVVAPPPGDQPLVVAGVRVLIVRHGALHLVDHNGVTRSELTPEEVVALSHLALPATPDATRQVVTSIAGLIDPDAFDGLVRHALAVGLLEPFDPADPGQPRQSDDEIERLRDGMRRRHRVLSLLATDAATAMTEKAERPDERVTVVPVAPANIWSTPPLSLGMLIAYAKAHDGGALERRYRFHPRWLFERGDLAGATDAPCVFLFSNYIWNHALNADLSAHTKALDPRHVTVHGGPDTPAYEADTARYFASRPDVDIVVHGEGEQTFVELLEALGDPAEPEHRFDRLHDVPGLSFRASDGSIVRTAPRDRITDLDTLPSPYLTGLFDAFRRSSLSVNIETNRGCPYGCTFCDWGSATLSRIRKFDLDRIMAELDWIAEGEVENVYVTDANFGIFERDVAIASRVADLKRRHGYPLMFNTNFAKNTVKHLQPIIATLAEGGILTEGKVSLQSMDSGTLTTIRRSNIKLEKYEELAVAFRDAQLPLVSELMMGLPGSTLESFANDLQECIDRAMPAHVYPSLVLPNSPMNDPVYRAEHGIVAAPGEIIRSTATYSEADYSRMERLRELFFLLDMYGILRQVGTFVRQESGVREIDLFALIDDVVEAEPDRWPALTFVLRSGPAVMAPPGSWRFFLDEIQELLVARELVIADSALETVLAVQHALLPAASRVFPFRVDLAHDYPAWFAAVSRARARGGGATWTDMVPRLATFGPGHFTVDDPRRLSRIATGQNVEALNFSLLDWELVSPVSRADTNQAVPQAATT